MVRRAGGPELTGPALRRLQVPSVRPLLYLDFGHPHRSPALPSFLSVGVEGARLLGSHDREHAIAVELTVLGAYRLAGVPVNDLAGQVVPLVDLWGSWVHRLEGELARLGDWPSRFALLDRALAARAEVGPAPAPEVLLAAWQLVRPATARLSLAGMADRLGWSRQHLTAMVGRQVGCSPRRLSRVARFERAASMLLVTDRPLAGVADACGYSDQAHLSRDFRDLAGCTPTRFLAERGPRVPAGRADPGA